MMYIARKLFPVLLSIAGPLFLFCAPAPAATWQVIGQLQADNPSIFKGSTTIIAPDTQSASLWASTSAITPHLLVSTSGLIGISNAAPAGRVDLNAAGLAATDMAQIWRNSLGAIQSSMSATGVMMAKKFIGDGSSLTGVVGDNLGNHIATKLLDMNGFNIIDIGSVTFRSNVYISSATPAQNGGLYISTSLYAAGVSSFTGATTMSGGSLNMANGTSNRIFYGNIGVNVPGANSVGEKIQLYGGYGSVAATDYAIGIEGSNIWFNTGGGFKFYKNSAIKHVFDSSDNVGISSATPMYRLVVSSAAGETGTILAVSTGASTMFEVKGTGEMIARKVSILGGQSTIFNAAGDITINPAGTNLIVTKNVDALSFTGDLAPNYITAGALGTSVMASSIAANIIVGGNIVAATIPLSKMNQSGCNTNDIVRWTGTKWDCSVESSNLQYYADEVSLHLDNATHIFSALKSSVTLMGNTFNGANQLIQADSSGLIPLAELPNLTNTYIWVGNGSNRPVGVAMSNDATMSNTGAVTLKNTGTAGTYRSVTTDNQGRVSAGTNPTTFAGYGLSDTSANLAAAITDETGSAGNLVFSNGPTLSGTVSLSGGDVRMTNATDNTIFFGAVGAAVPGAASVGEKIQLYGTAGTVGATDYAIGIESNNMWFNTNQGYKFYTNSGSGTQVMRIVPGATYISFFAGATEMFRLTP